MRSTATAFTFNAGTGEVAAVDFNTLSDLAMKTNITTILDPLGKVANLRGVHFNYRDTGKASVGVIAQELEPVLPDLVKMTPDGVRSVTYNGIIALLIEAVKEQQHQIQDLQARLGDPKED